MSLRVSTNAVVICEMCNMKNIDEFTTIPFLRVIGSNKGVVSSRVCCDHRDEAVFALVGKDITLKIICVSLITSMEF